jgi:copper chaperone CopZ
MKMKTIKLILPFCIVFFASLAFSQKAISQDKKTETIKIKTSAVCGMCKDRIENGMAFEKGVKDVSLDVETKEATIRYNVKSTNPDELRKKISKLGYDADGVAADTVAYKKLPACCKKDAPKH